LFPYKLRLEHNNFDHVQPMGVPAT